MRAHSVLPVCLTLCNPVDCSPPGSFVYGVFQARILEWGAIPFSRESSGHGDWTHVSCNCLHWQAGSLPLCHLYLQFRVKVVQTDIFCLMTFFNPSPCKIQKPQRQITPVHTSSSPNFTPKTCFLYRMMEPVIITIAQTRTWGSFGLLSSFHVPYLILAYFASRSLHLLLLLAQTLCHRQHASHCHFILKVLCTSVPISETLKKTLYLVATSSWHSLSYSQHSFSSKVLISINYIPGI